MIPVTAVGQVYDDIQRAKAGASAFCTNFFPMQDRLQGWIEHAELQRDFRQGVAFFLREDLGFAHLHYCAPSVDTLANGLRALPEIQSRALTTDLVGPGAMIEPLLPVFHDLGFNQYRRLVRLSRPARAETPIAASIAVEVAIAEDAPAVARLLESAFDRYADQLPTDYELQAAIEAGQVLVVRKGFEIGALIHFETQGVTSTVRYWAVAESCRSAGFGSAVIRHYFASQPKVRRFVLWVAADNENALQKYRHYGYAPDGLVDHVLVNRLIRS